MSWPKRNLTIGSIVLVLVAAEVGWRSLRAPVACVQVVNMGVEPIEGLRAVFGRSEAAAGKIGAGESARLHLSGRGKQALRLTYRQKGNAMTGFEVAGFDPADLQREGFMLVLNIRPNEYERYQDDGEPSLWRRFADGVSVWLDDRLKSP